MTVQWKWLCWCLLIGRLQVSAEFFMESPSNSPTHPSTGCHGRYFMSTDGCGESLQSRRALTSKKGRHQQGNLSSHMGGCWPGPAPGCRQQTPQALAIQQDLTKRGIIIHENTRRINFRLSRAAARFLLFNADVSEQRCVTLCAVSEGVHGCLLEPSTWMLIFCPHKSRRVRGSPQ